MKFTHAELQTVAQALRVAVVNTHYFALHFATQQQTEDNRRLAEQFRRQKNEAQAVLDRLEKEAGL